MKAGPNAQFEQQLHKLAAAQGGLLAQVVAIHAKAMTQAYALLTPAQRDKIEQLRGLLRPLAP